MHEHASPTDVLLHPSMARDLESRGFYVSRSACKKSSSTGVSRPKNETSTRILPFSWLISSISPRKSANGPSMMRTVSPSWKGDLDLRRFRGHALHDGLDARSSSGTGLLSTLTNPVTPGVFRSAYQVSSSNTIRTST